MKQLKTIVAFVAGLFAFTSVQAGEMTVTGSMQATYQSEVDDVTGNTGMNTDLTFTGNYDSDFGAITWTMGTDGVSVSQAQIWSYHLQLDLNIYNRKHRWRSRRSRRYYAFSVWRSKRIRIRYLFNRYCIGSGTMNLAYSNGDIMGTGISVAYNYYPQLSGQTENEKASSATMLKIRISRINQRWIPFSGF